MKKNWIFTGISTVIALAIFFQLTTSKADDETYHDPDCACGICADHWSDVTWKPDPKCMKENFPEEEKELPVNYIPKFDQ